MEKTGTKLTSKNREKKIKKQVKDFCRKRKGHLLLNFKRDSDNNYFYTRCEICGAGVTINLRFDDQHNIEGYKVAGNASSSSCMGSTGYPFYSREL